MLTQIKYKIKDGLEKTKSVLQDQRGQGFVEYGLLALIIVGIGIVAFLFGDKVIELFNQAIEFLTDTKIRGSGGGGGGF